jgi:CDP-diacylglycerol--glycerol-3-phosphate 3-phosphatidyltransferase
MLKTPADWITAARFVLSLVLFGTLAWIERHDPEARVPIVWIAWLIFVVAALTDAVDGMVARRTGMSDFGRIADPFVDKVLVVGTLVFLAAIPETRELIPAWAVVLIVAREFLVTGVRGYVESRGIGFPAEAAGKWKMVLQCLAVGGGLLHLANPSPPAPGTAGLWGDFTANLEIITKILIYATVALTLYSGITYIVRARRLLAAAPPR